MSKLALVIPYFNPLHLQLKIPSYNKTPFPTSNYLAIITALCQQDSIPWAAITAANRQLPQKSLWLKATPITLVTDHQAAYAYPVNNLLPELIKLLTDDLNQVFASDGIIFHAADYELLVEIPPELAIATYSWYEILNKDIRSYLPHGPNKAYWHKIFTEVQLFLHSHSINQAREQSNLPAINALWFWGEGVLTDTKPIIPWHSLISDSRLLKDFAQYTATDCYELSFPPQNLFTLLKSNTNYLITIEQFLYKQAHERSELTQQFMQQILLPLLQHLNNKTITEINLYPGDGYCYHLGREQHHWWHKFKHWFINNG